MSFNKIRAIEHLDKLSHLEALYLISNKIGRIEGLDNQVALRTLELAHNRIRVRRGRLLCRLLTIRAGDRERVALEQPAGALARPQQTHRD